MRTRQHFLRGRRSRLWGGPLLGYLLLAIALMGFLAISGCGSSGSDEGSNLQVDDLPDPDDPTTIDGSIQLNAAQPTSSGTVMRSNTFQMSGRMVGAPHQLSSTRFSMTGAF